MESESERGEVSVEGGRGGGVWSERGEVSVEGGRQVCVYGVREGSISSLVWESCVTSQW